MLLADLVACSAAVASKSSRRVKVDLLAGLLGAAGPGDAGLAACYLAGVLPQGRVGVGWASLRDVRVDPAPSPDLTLAGVAAAIEGIAGVSGAGAEAERRERTAALLAAATSAEQDFLASLLLGDVRHGALEALVTDALGVATGVPGDHLRRALMVGAGLDEVADAAVAGGASRVRRFRLRLFRPMRPMLASSAPDPGAALEATGAASVEHKVDGARIQVHRRGRRAAVYTRNLADVTGRMEEVAAPALAARASSLILDGEAVVLGDDGRPRPFQETAGRFGSAAGAAERLTPRFFDLVYLDGEDLTGRPLAERRRLLEGLLPAEALVPSVATSSPEEAAAFLGAALDAGQEGVVVKALDAPYRAGRRGSAWVKVKPVHTLDLVVLAAEWGYGRRTGWLSNLHLGARDPGGGFVMLGKTFKGLTDDMLRWQTERLLALEERRTRSTVHVHPEQVVEVAFDGVQASPRYPGGVTLRFARVRGYRDDKTAAEADTIDTVRAIHRGEIRPTVGG